MMKRSNIWLAFWALVACGENRTHPDRPFYEATPSETLSCIPNLDGRIDAAELKAQIGVPASFIVSPQNAERTIDLEGTIDDRGRRVWDWSTDFAEDQSARVSAAELSGRWYEDSFQNAEFVTPFDAQNSIEAVYSHDENGLYLHGFASRDENPARGRTLLVYQTPVAIYRFPVRAGEEWSEEGLVQNGMLRGLVYAGRDSYEVRVDATGELRLPDLTLTQAHRVRMNVRTDPAVGASVSLKQVSFLFECLGEVARATSRSNETEQNFTIAAEQRRLGL